MSGQAERRKWRVLWAIPGVLVILILAGILLVPRLANQDMVRKRLTWILQDRVGIPIRFEGMAFSYLPVPHLGMHGVAMDLPGGGEGKAASVTVYPRVLPLLRGKVRVSRLEIDSARLKIAIPKGGREIRGNEALALLLAPLALGEPDLKIVLREGNVEVLQEDAPPIHFRDLAAEMILPPEGFTFRVSCASTLWEDAVLDGRLDVQVLRGEGRLALKGLQLGPVLDLFLSSSETKVRECSLDLESSFKLEGLQGLQAEIQGVFPGMTLVRSGRKATLKSGRFHVEAGLEAEGITIALKELSLQDPKLAASGELALGGEEGEIKVRLEGRDMEIPSVRQKVLAIVGDNPNAAKLFGVLRAGVVPGVVFQSAVGSVSELFDLQNMVIAGRLEQGKVQVPGVELDLVEVKGEATLSEGVLEGTSLEAKHGNTRGQQGTLKLGLRGEDAPFQLDIQVHADLSELQPVLRRVVTHKVFRSEMEKTRELQGKASGRLQLGDRLSDIRARVEVSEFDLSARYHEIPYPVQLRGGRHFYEGTNSHGRDLQCQVGRSSLSGLSWNLDWAQEPHMTVELRRGRISVEEILSWVSSVEPLQGAVKGIRSVGGEVLLRETHAGGPLLDPVQWRFEVSGEIPHLYGEVESFPAPLRVTSGRFTADPEKLVLKDVETLFMDTSLTVSGSLDGYLRGLTKTDLTCRGQIGTRTLDEFTRFSWGRRPVQVRSALSLRPMRFLWDREGSLGFIGQTAVQGGPTLTVDIRREPGQWVVNQVHVRDEDSDATFSLRWTDRDATATFSGTLSEKTLDRIVAGYESQQGWMRGDIQVHLVKDRLQDCWARGRVEADDFSVLHLLPASLDLDEVAVKAEDRRVQVESLKFTWAKTRFSAAGSFEVGAEGFLTDMDFYSSVFDWDQFRAYLPAAYEGARVGDRGWLSGFPLLGSVRIHFDQFIHTGFTWSPLKAGALFSRKKVEAQVTEAEVCGISTLGSVLATPERLAFQFQALAADQEALPSLECFTEGRRKATGRFDLRLDLQGRAREEQLLSSLQGSLAFSARNGRILDHILFERINHYLSLAGIFRGDQEYGGEGIPYDSILVKATIQNGRCTFQEAVLDGVDLEAGFEGQVDLVGKTIDGRLLVAPFRTANRIVDFIPLVRTIMGGTLVAIPVRVSGSLDDPRITPLAPSAVGRSLLDMMRRTFSMPVQMFDPLIHQKEEK